MGNEQNNGQLTQACRIIVMFPVESDEQALTVKRHITEALSEIKEAQLDFSIRTMPLNTPIRSMV